MVDRYGVLVKVGSVITYPGRVGSRMYMVTAVVVDTERGKIFVRPVDESGKTVFEKRQYLTHITAIERVTVLPHMEAVSNPDNHKYGVFRKEPIVPNN